MKGNDRNGSLNNCSHCINSTFPLFKTKRNIVSSLSSHADQSWLQCKVRLFFFFFCSVRTDISTQKAYGRLSSESNGFSQTNDRIVYSGRCLVNTGIYSTLTLCLVSLYICVLTHAVFQYNWTHNLDVFLFTCVLCPVSRWMFINQWFNWPRPHVFRFRFSL